MAEHKVFFTGHRPDRLWGYNIQDERYNNLKEQIKSVLIEKNCTELYNGMALGADVVAAMAVLELRDLGYNIKLHICIPCKDQDKLWNLSDRARYAEILDRADIVEYVSEKEFEPQLMKERNHFMVDNCIEGLAVINSDMAISRTGTQECINYAEKHEVPVKIIDIGTGINKQKAVAKEASKRAKTGITLETLEKWRDLENFIVMDFETTGFSFLSGNRIIDIGAFEVNGNNIVSKYEQLVNPQQLIPRDITKLTGITDNMVKVKPTINQVLPILLNYVGDKKIVFHNSDFDYYKFLKPTYDCLHTDTLEIDVLCTLKLDRFLRANAKKHSLDAVYKDLTGKDAMIGAHRASVDALMTAEVAVILRNFIRSNWNYVVSLL